MDPKSSADLPVPIRAPSSRHAPIPPYYTEISPGERRSTYATGGPSGLFYYFRLIRRRLGILVVIAFLGGLAGVLATIPQKRLYQAHSTLEIRALNVDFSTRQGDPNAPAPDSTPSDAYLQTQIKILQSKSLADRVLAKMQSSGQLVAEQYLGRLAAWMKALGLKRSEPVDPHKVGRELARSLGVRTLGQTPIVEISAESGNPKVAADFLNTLGAEFIQQNLEGRSQSSYNAGAALSRQIDEMRSRMEASESRLQSYSRQSGLIISSDKSMVSEDKLRQMQAELNRAQSERVAKQSRYELARNTPPDSQTEVFNDPAMRDSLAKLTELKRQLTDLSAHFTPEHYRVQAVQTQIASLEAVLQKQKAGVLERIHNDYDEAAHHEKMLADAYASQTRLVSKDGEKAIQYDTLKREVDSNRQIYGAMLQKVKESGVAAAMRSSNIRVIDPAEIPERPFRPNLLQNAVMGVLGGLLLGMALVVVREQADRTIQQPGEAANYINVPELGAIPSAKVSAVGRLSQRLQGPTSDVIPASNRAEFIISQNCPVVFAEAIRAVLLSIAYSGGNDSKSVLVLTSSSPGEGKTTVATNLAMAFAGLNRKVLLIDGDLHKPRVHQIFGLSNDLGLTDLLEGKATLDAPGGALIHESGVKNLSVLTSGGSSGESTVLLHEDRLRELIGRFRVEFDVVIVDTPPLLQISDARVMARIADAMILVVRAGQTTRDAITAVHERLAEDGTRVLGLILNDWNPRSSVNGYYGNYGGGYSKYQKGYSRPADPDKQAKPRPPGHLSGTIT